MMLGIMFDKSTKERRYQNEGCCKVADSHVDRY
jgi:polyferredoxin